MDLSFSHLASRLTNGYHKEVRLYSLAIMQVLLHHHHTYSLPEPEVVDAPDPAPDPEAVLKAEKKKAEHKRYKAKKKAEAAAKRQAEKEAAEEEAEASEPSKSQAELQAEEDARLGEKRMKQQAAREERLEKVASLINSKQ